MTKSELIEVLRSRSVEGLDDPMPEDLWENLKEFLTNNEKEKMAEFIRGLIVMTRMNIADVLESDDYEG